MPIWLNIILTIIYMLCIVAIVVLLWFIWHSGVKRSQRLEQALIDAALSNAASTRKTAEAADTLAKKQTGEHQVP